jgi:hypothetical protein
MGNDSIGKERTINDLQSIRIYTFPYERLVQGYTQTEQAFATQSATILPKEVSHPVSWWYTVTLSQPINASNHTTIKLSQSFDRGWIAISPTASFPFFTPIGDHLLISNWANGWKINKETQTIYLLFWPQLLQYLGILLLPLPFLFMGRKTHA